MHLTFYTNVFRVKPVSAFDSLTGLKMDSDFMPLPSFPESVAKADGSAVNWSDLLEILQKYTRLCQDRNARANLDKEIFRKLETYMKIMIEDDNLNDALVETFRFLRNAVAECKRNQEVIREETTIFDTTANFLKAQHQIKDIPKTEANSNKVLAIRCGIQFVANSMVDNKGNCDFVLSTFNENICPLLYTFSDDEKIIQYVAMLIHIGLKQSPDKLVTDSQFLGPLLQNLHLEYVVYAIESLVMQSHFIGNSYDLLDPASRIKLLSFLIERSDLIANLSDEVIAKFKESFIERSDFILRSKIGDSDDVFCWEIAILLELLCTASAHGVEQLKSDQVLITTVLYLLKQIDQAGKTGGGNENMFSPVEDLQKLTSKSLETTEADDIRAHPTFQFKAHLVRFIGNLAHMNKSNQDKVRELGCLPIILDSCRIDARNPFIAQWSVFTIRNLCEGNETNQAYISNVQRADTEELLPKIKLVGLK